jgi:hypothetical protein
MVVWCREGHGVSEAVEKWWVWEETTARHPVLLQHGVATFER